jgi:Phage integrase family
VCPKCPPVLRALAPAAKLPFPVHPHMLRHACGFKLANDGHDTRSLAHYLGHRNLQSAEKYTALAPDRFAGFWKDYAAKWEGVAANEAGSSLAIPSLAQPPLERLRTLGLQGEQGLLLRNVFAPTS